MLSPTRELARQTEMVLLALGDYMKAKVFLVVGGEKVGDMMVALNSGVHVVVGERIIVCTSQCTFNTCTLHYNSLQFMNVQSGLIASKVHAQ